MHKIDREKLREALEVDKSKSFTLASMYKRKHGVTFTEVKRQAAENWLEISDPGYVPTVEMLYVGHQSISSGCDINLEEAKVIFKTMIAKAGE